MEHSFDATQEPGRYAIELLVQRGEHYRLVGKIDEQPVFAETLVPRNFAVRVPAADTITAADGGSFDLLSDLFVSVPYRFDSEGASAYDVVVIGERRGLTLNLLERAEGEVLLRRGDAVRNVAFIAYNADAAEWLGRRTPRSNIPGAFGGFGAASVVWRKLWIP